MSRPEKLDRLIAYTLVLAAILPVTLKLVVAFYVEGRLVSGVGMGTSYWEITFKLFGMLSWTAFGILFLLRIAMDIMQQLTKESVTDPLTGVLNRRGFSGRAKAALDEASSELPVAIMIFDIDRFKTINDSYGHSVGDTVIQRLARVLENAAGESGIVCRLGGEEFAALLPRADARAAILFAQGARTAFLHEHHAGIPQSRRPTVSVGMAESCGGENLDDVLDRADAALYCAKCSGRNRVERSIRPSRQRVIGIESGCHA